MSINRDEIVKYLVPVICIWIIDLLAMSFFSESNIEVYKYIVSLCIVVSFVLAFILAIIKFGIVSLQSLFLTCLFLFNYSRIFLFIVGAFDFTRAPYSYFAVFEWKESTIKTVCNYYLVFNTVFLLSMLLTHKRSITNKKKSSKNQLDSIMTQDFVRKTFTIIFFISLPFMVYSLATFSVSIMLSGYGTLYTGGLQSYEGNAILRISRMIFNTCFYVICMTERDEKRFTRIGIIYIMVTGIQLLQGSRGYFIVAILTIMYIRYRKFGVAFRVRTMALLAIVMIPGIYFIALFRDNALNSFNLGDAVTYFLEDMSGSLNVPAYYLQHKSELLRNSVPFVFDPIVRIIEVLRHPLVYSGGQTIDYIHVTSDLGHILTYNISPSYYLAGNNIASNFIAEMSEFGLSGVFVGSLIFSYMLFKFDKVFCKNTFFMFMSSEFLLKILYVPRAELFYDSYSLIKYGAIYFGIYLFASFINSHSKSKKV